MDTVVSLLLSGRRHRRVFQLHHSQTIRLPELITRNDRGRAMGVLTDTNNSDVKLTAIKSVMRSLIPAEQFSPRTIIDEEILPVAWWTSVNWTNEEDSVCLLVKFCSKINLFTQSLMIILLPTTFTSQNQHCVTTCHYWMALLTLLAKLQNKITTKQRPHVKKKQSIKTITAHTPHWMP